MPISHEQYQMMVARLDKNTKRDPEERPVDGVECESDLHNDISDECKKRGWIVFHGSMAHRTRRTIAEPDFIIIASGGRVIMLEAKSKTGKLAPEQLALKVWAERLGFPIHIVRSMGDVLKVFDMN